VDIATEISKHSNAGRCLAKKCHHHKGHFCLIKCCPLDAENLRNATSNKSVPLSTAGGNAKRVVGSDAELMTRVNGNDEA
jgi:hypothetical protein